MLQSFYNWLQKRVAKFQGPELPSAVEFMPEILLTVIWMLTVHIVMELAIAWYFRLY